MSHPIPKELNSVPASTLLFYLSVHLEKTLPEKKRRSTL